MKPFPTGGGIAGSVIRDLDWAKTPLGPTATWPKSLVAVVETMVNSRHPMFLWWGPELIQFYNDAYLPSFGTGKHPAAMGQRGAECWTEIWPIIGPQIDGVMTAGIPTWHEDALVPIFRNGRIEEVYWTYGYSPVFDDDRQIGGTLVVCTETTSRVLANRRQNMLRVLVDRSAMTNVPGEVTAIAFATLAQFAADVPFVALFDADGGELRRIHGADPDVKPIIAAAAVGALRSPARVTLGQPIAAGPWPEPVTEVFAVPMPTRGVLVFGISARLQFDDAYCDLLLQLVAHLSSAEARCEAFALQAAAEAERRELIMQAPIAMALLTGPQHRFALANPMYLEMVGRDVVGKSYLEAFPERVGSEMPRILDEVYATGVPFIAPERQVEALAGVGRSEPYYIKLGLQPIRNATGAVFGMVAVAVEITEIVRARERQRELLVDVETAARAKDEFLAMLGHELRNPLAPIVSALQLVRLRGGASGELEVIERHTGHLIRLVDDLLDVSKITRGKVELKHEATTIGDVIAKAVEITASLLEQRGHRLELDLPREPLPWFGDPVRLAQVITNLLTNAARYTARGGVIGIAATRDPAGATTIRVRDTGSGIAPELLPHVFDLFVQGKRSPDRAEGGLGIGLTLVKNLVDLHGGTVSAHSAGRGHGSEFVVSLPPAASRDTTPTPPRPIAAQRSSRRVLVVDDNVDAADLMADVLRARGHVVSVAFDANRALAAFAAFAPDVALVDIGLPGMDGYELAGRLAMLDARCKLIALTGYSQERDRARTAAAGFAAHLVKPVKLDVLLDALDPE